MKILLATDGTRYGDAAVEMIRNLRLGSGDEIKIISVVDLAMPLAIDIYGGYLPDNTELEKGARENASRIVDAAATLVRGFSVDGFGSAVLGALVVSIVSWVIGLITNEKKR